MKFSLSRPIISVIAEGEASCGGNQRLFENPTMRGYGCGVIGGADLLYYLALTRPDWATPYTGSPRDNSISFPHYARYCARLRRDFMPIIPKFGKTGPDLALGLNAYFSRYNIPLRARWCVGHEKLFERMEEMLSADLPIIFSVGANFPNFFGKHRVKLYTRSEDGAYVPSASTRAHFMTVTGLDDDFIRVSSWGREYFISRSEYLGYTKRYGSSVTSNIMYLSKKI